MGRNTSYRFIFNDQTPLTHPTHGGETIADTQHGLHSAYHLSISLAGLGSALSVVFLL
jgi:hypothetical protein